MRKRKEASWTWLVSTLHLHFLSRRRDILIEAWLECSWTIYDGPGTVLRALHLKNVILFFKLINLFFIVGCIGFLLLHVGFL